MDNACVNRVTQGAAVGGALGASIGKLCSQIAGWLAAETGLSLPASAGALYGTYDAFKNRVRLAG